MMLRDRLTGRDLVSIPPVVHPGRYLLLQDMTLNGHSVLPAGSLLCGDGGERCQLDGLHSTFVSPDVALAAKADLLIDAVTTITSLMESGIEEPSPLLPAGLITEKGQLTPLERELGAVLSAGHLQVISVRPRLDLKYEQEVTDVARARRLANNSLTHLASHSECWQRQTLSGVIPRQILARFSNDDYSIYENRVYARLLDGLDNYLTARLRRLEALRSGLEQALKLTESTDLDYRLTTEICALWGRTFSDSQTRAQLRATSETLKVLANHHTTIRGLKQTGLYLNVPRSAQIDGVLHRTNILNHDPHYRHLVPLWDRLQNINKAARQSPDEVLSRHQNLESRYCGYVGLVLRQALSNLGLNSLGRGQWAGHDLHLRPSGDDWVLEVDGQPELILVPWACLQSLPEEVNAGDDTRRMVCWPGIEQEDELDSAWNGHAVKVSPLDLYVVERLGACLDEALNKLLLSRYGKPLKPLPSPVVAEASGIKAFPITGHQGHLLQALSPEDAERLLTLLQQNGRQELVRDFALRQAEAMTLSHCPVCGSISPLTPQADGGFSSQCVSCNCKRYWRRMGDHRWHFQQLLNDSVDFRQTGRRSLEFVLLDSF